LAHIKTSPVDIAMVIYGLAATVSFVMAEDKKTSIIGPYGWFTGFLFQYGLIAIYFSSSRWGRLDKRLIYTILVSAMIIFAIGILHRFQIDVIGIYRYLKEEDYIRFLSTIGQATWYSSYLCIVFPLGLHLYIFTSDTSIRRVSAAFIILGAASLVTQNSDTAYGALFVVLCCYCIFLVKDNKQEKIMLSRYGRAIVMMSAAVLFTGILERVFSERFVMLDKLSLRIAQGYAPVIGVAIGIGVMLLANAKEAIRRACVIAIGLLIVAGAVALVARTASGVYFTFDRDWGNGRGLIWYRTFQMYKDLPLINKLLGIGIGTFYQRISPYTDLVLANAHNEWLTAFVEMGTFGGCAYLAVFVTAIITSIKRLRKHEAYVVIAIVLAYMVHGLFCYQQCVSTPMIFVLVGILLGEQKYIGVDDIVNS
jgi:O-antigen ligase